MASCGRNYGVQRWLKFTKYLPDLGYEVHVYCPENPSYPILDESLLTEINPAVKVIRQKIWEPYQLAEKLNPKNKAYKGGHFEKKKVRVYFHVYRYLSVVISLFPTHVLLGLNHLWFF